MSRIFSLLTVLIIVVGCAQAPHQQLVYQSENSILKEETLMFGAEVASNNYLQSCYKNDMPQFYAKSHEHFTKNPKDWKYWSIMGNCLVWKNQLREALFYLKSSFVLAADPKDKAVVLANMGIANLRLNRAQKGLSLMLEAYKNLPDSSVLNFNLAQYYLSYSDPTNAEKYLNKLMKAKTLEAEMLHMLGVYYSLKKDLVKTSQYLSRLPASYETREDVSLTLAEWYLDQGNWQKASEILDKRKVSQFVTLEDRAKVLNKRMNEMKNQKRFGT